MTRDDVPSTSPLPLLGKSLGPASVRFNPPLLLLWMIISGGGGPSPGQFFNPETTRLQVTLISL